MFSKFKEIPRKRSLVELKVENSITCIGMFRKVDLLVISRNSGLLSTGFGAIQNELLLNVLKVVLKILEKFQEELCNGDSVWKTAGL